MSYYNMQFIHKPLVQVKIGCISGSLYPMLVVEDMATLPLSILKHTKA